MSPSASPIWYVYGVASPALAEHAPPAGLDEAPVVLERAGDLVAIASCLNADAYAPARIEAASGDVEWLSPRAVAHDRVLTWASDWGAVVPFPMFSLFSSADAVGAMLADRQPQLTRVLERVGPRHEYALRVYRVDAELLAAAPSLSPRLRALAAEAAAASPGQRYLLERKLEGETRAEMRDLTRQLIDEIVAALEPHAADTVRSPIPSTADVDRGTMVLNGAFLVAPDAVDGFQKTLTDLVDRFGATGFRFDFTGPWPPYHFVANASHG